MRTVELVEEHEETENMADWRVEEDFWIYWLRFYSLFPIYRWALSGIASWGSRRGAGLGFPTRTHQRRTKILTHSMSTTCLESNDLASQSNGRLIKCTHKYNIIDGCSWLTVDSGFPPCRITMNYKSAKPSAALNGSSRSTSNRIIIARVMAHHSFYVVVQC